MFMICNPGIIESTWNPPPLRILPGEGGDFLLEEGGKKPKDIFNLVGRFSGGRISSFAVFLTK